MKQFERCQNSRAVLPHPSPLPLGEGASLSASVFSERVALDGDVMPVSLSQREWAGVREDAPYWRVTKQAKPEAASIAEEPISKNESGEWPDVRPHPSPLPLGEGASQSASELSERISHEGDGMRFFLSQRERAGVRESATHSRVTIKCVSGRFRPRMTDDRSLSQTQP